MKPANKGCKESAAPKAVKSPCNGEYKAIYWYGQRYWSRAPQQVFEKSARASAPPKSSQTSNQRGKFSDFAGGEKTMVFGAKKKPKRSFNRSVTAL
ncbi:MAG: hypothetical protein ACXV5R_10380 [Candidatus Angelobacter sp.]